MPTQEQRLKTDLVRLQTLHEQAKVALANVMDLLAKADARSAKEGERRWGRIVENLEDALQLAKARVTGYEQLVRQCEQHLESLSRAGARAPEIFSAEEFEDILPDGLALPPDHMAAAERILGMSLDDLGSLTIEQVMNMNTQLYEQPPERAAPPPAPESEYERPRSALDMRIERARETRESLAAARRQSQQPSFAERRRQKLLRDAITKISTGKTQMLDFEEIELLIHYHNGLVERVDKSESDVRLQSMLARIIPALEERASDLRRKRAQAYRRH